MLAEKDLKRELANRKNAQKLVSDRRLTSLRNRKPGIVSDVFDQLDSQESNDFEESEIENQDTESTAENQKQVMRDLKSVKQPTVDSKNNLGSLNEFGAPAESQLDANEMVEMEQRRALNQQRIAESRQENLANLNPGNQRIENKNDSLEKSENDLKVENEKDAARQLKTDKEKEGGKKEELSFAEQITQKMDAAFMASQQATSQLLKAAWVNIPDTIGLSFLYVILHGVAKYILPSDLVAKFFCRYGEEWVPAIGAKIEKAGGSVKKVADTAQKMDQKIPGSQVIETGKRTLESVEKGAVVLVVFVIFVVALIQILLLLGLVFSPAIIAWSFITD